MEVSFINVGYGDSILIEYGNNNDERDSGGKFNILIDGGSAQDEEYEGFPQRIRTIGFLKKKGIKKIDILVITHIHDDHVCGLVEVVKQLEIGEVWCNFRMPDELLGKRLPNPFDYNGSLWKFTNALNAYNEIMGILTSKGVKILETEGIQLGRKIRELLNVDILGPADNTGRELKEAVSKIFINGDPINDKEVLDRLDKTLNNTSIVLRFDFCGHKILLPGDVYSSHWTGMLKSKMELLEADIVKIPHHGQVDGVSEEFIDSVKPGFAVICASNDRRYGSSSPQAIELIEKCAARIGKKVKIIFSDSVHMPPYSTSESNHNAVVFRLKCGKPVEYRFLKPCLQL